MTRESTATTTTQRTERASIPLIMAKQLRHTRTGLCEDVEKQSTTPGAALQGAAEKWWWKSGDSDSSLGTPSEQSLRTQQHKHATQRPHTCKLISHYSIQPQSMQTEILHRRTVTRGINDHSCCKDKTSCAHFHQSRCTATESAGVSSSAVASSVYIPCDRQIRQLGIENM